MNMYTGEDIKQQREAKINNIVKSFSNSDMLEKANHQVGDIHPNGKWIWTEYKPGKFNWRVIKKTPKIEDKDQITVKQAYNDIQFLNPSVSTVSSIGTFVSSQNQQMADDEAKRIMGYLPKDSIAYKIVSSSDRFSDKQLWVIAYELMKNKEYQRDLAKSIEEDKKQSAYQKAKKSLKRKMKSERKKQVEVSSKKYEEIDSEEKIEHPVFGEGKILSQTDDKMTVFFKKVGQKELLKKFTSYKKL